MTLVTPWVFGVARPARERFEERVRVTPGCWIWLGYKNPKGYGRINNGNRDVMAHRFSYELYVGPIPAGKIICHKCDNPSCVNPDHLWVGTDQENADDKVAKGRWVGGDRKGEAHAMARLSNEAVYAIRADGRPLRSIAKQYGITRGYVRGIKERASWAHLPSRGDEVGSPDGRARTPRLTLEQQRAVRSDTRTYRVIAADFGVDPRIIGRIKHGRDGYSHHEMGP
jgi:hypothetical protein